MTYENYPCYVKIGDENDNGQMSELPTQNDGKILLSTIQAQYPDAVGLRFKCESGAWSGVQLSGNALLPPFEGWGYNEYFITFPRTGAKRKFDDDSDGRGSKTKKTTDEEMLSDLIVMGLPYSATEEDLKNYFEQFGELDMYQIKFDAENNKSRGFGFIRFKSVEVVEAVLAATHTIMGRRCQVNFPTKGKQDGVATKLFVGRLPAGTSTGDLRSYFSEYGVLTDVYVPAQFRGFGFITFASPASATEVLSKQHMIRGAYVNISYPTPKGGSKPMQPQSYTDTQQPQYGYGKMQSNTQGNRQSNTQGNRQSNNIQVNLEGNTQEYLQGNTQGNMQSNTQGNMQSNTQGNMQSNIQGNMQSNIQVNLEGTTQGNLQGNMQGNMYSNTQGNMYSNTQGNVYGNTQGNVYSNTQGNMYSNTQGNIYSNIQGNLQGDMQGNIPIIIQGNTHSNMQGNMQGNILQLNLQGNMQGNMQGNVEGNMQAPPTYGLPVPEYGYGDQGSNMVNGYYSGYIQPEGNIQSGQIIHQV